MTSLEELTATLCRAVVECPALRVPGPALGYRNKITYSLRPSFSVSDLADGRINEACSTVYEFSTKESLFFDVWCEVCAKRTRRDELLIKTSFRCDEKIFTQWKNEESAAFVRYVQKQLPSCTALIAHTSNSSSTAKPGKHDQYVTLIGSGCVVEYTPNGFGFSLSADSFCEVNHTMEDAMFSAALRMLQLGEHASEGKKRRAFMTGRDINSVYRTFAGYYAEPVVAVTSCPRVHMDTIINGIPCDLCSKDCIGPDHIVPKVGGRVLEEDDTSDGRFDMLVTAGRHGLHRNTVDAINSVVQHVASVLYVSCNVESMTRDVHLFKSRFFIRDAAVFDFFPGTSYVMTMLVLEPFAVLPRKLLVLPVGPPLVGKSSSCRYLRDMALASEKLDGDKVKAHQQHLRQQRGIVSVIRDMPRIQRQLQVDIFERDCVFHMHKEKGCSLRKAKEGTHSDLLAALGDAAGHDDDRPASAATLCIDSTNGSADARTLYIEEWRKHHTPFKVRTSDGRSTESSFYSPLIEYIVINMKVSNMNVDASTSAFLGKDAEDDSIASVLCQRAVGRRDHPAFPREKELQRKKITDIMRALERDHEGPFSSLEQPSSTGHTGLTTVLENGASESETSLAFAWQVFCCLFCSSLLARKLLSSLIADSDPGRSSCQRDVRVKRSRSSDNQSSDR
jgi:hypothetical protein